MKLIEELCRKAAEETKYLTGNSTAKRADEHAAVMIRELEPLRQYVHDVETRCDPAGDVQTIADLREQRDALAARVAELEGDLAKRRVPVEVPDDPVTCANCQSPIEHGQTFKNLNTHVDCPPKSKPTIPKWFPPTLAWAQHEDAKASWPWYGRLLHRVVVGWRCPCCLYGRGK